MTNLDRFDTKILRELKTDANQTNVRLAEKVGLSPSACLRRVQELERQGIIKGYRAVIDREKTQRGFLVYVAVGLSDHRKESLKAFESAVAQATEVTECHDITGTREYLLRVEVEDINSYKRFHTDKLGMFPNVTSITSYVVMGTSKDER